MIAKLLPLLLFFASIICAMGRNARDDTQNFCEQTICESPTAKKVTLMVVYGGIVLTSGVLLVSEAYTTLNCFSNSCVSGPTVCKVTCPFDEFIKHCANDAVLTTTLGYSWDRLKKLLSWCTQTDILDDTEAGDYV